MMPIHAPRLPTWELRQVRFLLFEKYVHPSLTNLGCNNLFFIITSNKLVNTSFGSIKFFDTFGLTIDHFAKNVFHISVESLFNIKFLLVRIKLI
ncbi:hypothetical protein HanRHA438_Chr11g0510211 [Helianthus annuus]|nr:hypothetical protein HanRHA438_Chr11g0510211 [Helianthus annuus]